MDSREGLLQAALTLFTAKGYDAVGVQEVASATGVAKPTLYHFFGSKYGLLEALFEEHATTLNDAVGAATDYAGDLPLTLDRIVAAYVAFAGREPLFYRLELGLYFAPRDSDAHRVAVRHYSQRQVLIEEVFRKAVRQHGNMRGRHRRYAVSLVGMINSYVALQLNDHIVITDRLRRDIVHQFSHGIYS
ncbi:MAG TPA: TetR/AcrR family transcriptional regulator [Candidatus Binataceae bacterium]